MALNSLSPPAFLCALALAISLHSLPASATTTAYPSIPGTDSVDCSPAGGDSDLVPPRREVYDNGRIFDITHKYAPDLPVWGSDDGLGRHFLWLGESMKNGSLYNGSAMKLGVHTGTHVDAPGHFYDNYFDAGFDVDSLDLEVLNGKNGCGYGFLYRCSSFCLLSLSFFCFLWVMMSSYMFTCQLFEMNPGRRLLIS